MKRFFVLLLVLVCLGLAACETTNTPQPSEEPSDPYKIYLNDDPDISTFEGAMQLWESGETAKKGYTDSGIETLDFVFASKDNVSLTYCPDDGTFVVAVTKPNKDYWHVGYTLDGEPNDRFSRTFQEDGSYVEISESFLGDNYIYHSYAADGSLLSSVERLDCWHVSYYDRIPEKLTVLEEINQIIKDAHRGEYISQQTEYALHIQAGEDGSNQPILQAYYDNGKLEIGYIEDEANQYGYKYEDGVLIWMESVSTTEKYRFYELQDDAEISIEGNRGTFKYKGVEQRVVTAKILPHETLTVVGYPLTEHTNRLDIEYHYLSDDSVCCYQIDVKDHKTGDYLVFHINPVPDPYLDVESIDWTRNGITTHYDPKTNPLGALVLEMPWHANQLLYIDGIPWSAIQ